MLVTQCPRNISHNSCLLTYIYLAIPPSTSMIALLIHSIVFHSICGISVICRHAHAHPACRAPITAIPGIAGQLKLRFVAGRRDNLSTLHFLIPKEGVGTHEKGFYFGRSFCGVSREPKLAQNQMIEFTLQFQ